MLPLKGEQSGRPQPFRLMSGSAASTMAHFRRMATGVMYISEESGPSQVYVAPFHNGRAFPEEKRQVSSSPSLRAAWGKTGKEIIYQVGRKLISVPVDPTTGLRIGQEAKWFAGCPFWDLTRLLAASVYRCSFVRSRPPHSR